MVLGRSADFNGSAVDTSTYGCLSFSQEQASKFQVHVAWDVVHAFYAAYMSRESQRTEAQCLPVFNGLLV